MSVQSSLTNYGTLRILQNMHKPSAGGYPPVTLPWCVPNVHLFAAREFVLPSLMIVWHAPYRWHMIGRERTGVECRDWANITIITAVSLPRSWRNKSLTTMTLYSIDTGVSINRTLLFMSPPILLMDATFQCPWLCKPNCATPWALVRRVSLA